MLVIYKFLWTNSL